MKVRAKILLVVLFVLVKLTLVAQSSETLLEGTVSYVSSQHVYVKFASTEGLHLGDTLFIQNGGKKIPALLIQQLSSISCVTNPIGDLNFVKGDFVYANTLIKEIEPAVIPEVKQDLLPEPNEVAAVEEIISKEKEPKYKQDIWGRINLSSYSNFSNNFNNDNQRFRYRLNLNANQIANSPISFETYVAFSHSIYDGTSVPSSLKDLKLYTLALRYDLSKNTRVWLGRKINSKIANVGAVDGLQVETTFKNITLGAVAGSRPSYTDYGFDFSLFEFGGYIAHQYNGTKGRMDNTFSFFEQKNSGKTDRRFMYFQHSNSLAKNVNAFVSFEMDMYRLENGLPVNKLSLTSMYASVRYRFSSNFSATASYDARKNVIYYETFQTLADSILESSTRQGFRVRANYRPLKRLLLGASASYRNKPEDSRPTKNANAFITYSQLPLLKASLSLTANYIQSSYLDGQIYGARLNKDLFQGKLYAGLNYRYVDYNFVNSSTPLKQHITELSMQWQVVKNLSLSASYEGVFEKDNQYNRIYLSLRKRF